MFEFSSMQPPIDIPEEKQKEFERNCPSVTTDIKAKIAMLDNELDSMPKITESERNAAFDVQKKEEEAKQEKDDLEESKTDLMRKLKL